MDLTATTLEELRDALMKFPLSATPTWDADAIGRFGVNLWRKGQQLTVRIYGEGQAVNLLLTIPVRD